MPVLSYSLEYFVIRNNSNINVWPSIYFLMNTEYKHRKVVTGLFTTRWPSPWWPAGLFWGGDRAAATQNAEYKIGPSPSLAMDYLAQNINRARMEKLVSCDNNWFSLGFVQMRQFGRTSLYTKINCVVHSLTATSVLINYPFAWRNVWIGRLGQQCLKHRHRFWYVISWKLESLHAQELHDAWDEHRKVLLRSC